MILDIHDFMLEKTQETNWPGLNTLLKAKSQSTEWKKLTLKTNFVAFQSEKLIFPFYNR